MSVFASMTIGLVYPDFVFCPQGESLFVFDLFPFDLLEEVAPKPREECYEGCPQSKVLQAHRSNSGHAIA